MGKANGTTGVWWGIQKERDHSQDLVVDGRIILELVLRNIIGVRRETGSFLFISTSGELLREFGFLKIFKILVFTGVCWFHFAS